MATNEPIIKSEPEQETKDDEKPCDHEDQTDDDDKSDNLKTIGPATTAQTNNDAATTAADAADAKEDEDEDLEEGELKDDDDDDDDDDEELTTNTALSSSNPASRLSGYHNNNASTNNNKNNNNSSNNNNNSTSNNNNDNTCGFSKELSFGDSRHDPQQHPHYPNYPPHHHSASGGQPPPHLYMHQPNRRLSPNSQHQADMQAQYPPMNHHQHHNFSSNSNNNNHYRYQPNDGPPPQPMNHHVRAGGPVPPGMYPRGGPGGAGPMHRVRCRFYSSNEVDNKCTWGAHCRFEHRDGSPDPEFDGRPPPPMNPGPAGSSRGPPPMMGAERGPYPPYSSVRHQPYPLPPPPPHVYPYEGYGHHHSTPPPLPPHPMSHWRQQQHSPYPSPSGHPPESVSPALLPTPGVGPGGPGSSRLPPAPPGSSGSSGAGGPVGSSGAPVGPGGAPSPGYPSPSSSSSAFPYERKHRLAYEMAPWNDRGYHPPPGSKYDRGDPAGAYPPAGPPGPRGYYRSHYGREPPAYGREPPPHMGGGAHPGYPPYSSAYRGGSMGPHASHYKFMSSSQRTVPPDARRSRSTKRGHDEDESSWSDSGSEDSILGQANYSNKNHANKSSKLQHPQSQPPSDNLAADEPPDQGSGTPQGEPSPEDRERQEMLLNKLKEIEDLMAKKKGEQEDSV